jgi:hypothetical protein
MEDDILKGLEYDNLVLDQNVHKLVGTVTKLQNNNTADVNIDEGAVWLVTGLGYLSKEAPDQIIQTSLDDTIILSKSKLTEFIKSKK